MVVERAYAKINLTLDVLTKRDDGFHEIDMVLQTIDLSDVVWLEDVDGDEIVVDSSASNIPLDDRNLAVVAARLFQEHTGIQRGVHIRLDKSIPVAAGLAGGSADAAAVLRGLNRLWNTGLSMEDLAALGASVGSDVPFCVYGGCAVARGRGERLQRVDHPLRAWVVLLRPQVYVSTGEVYQATLPEQYTARPTSPGMVAALQAADFDAVVEQVGNGLQATTLRLYPEVAALKEKVESVTRQPVFMSGSGPTLFLLLPTRSAAQRAYNALRGFIKEVYLSRFVSL